MAAYRMVWISFVLALAGAPTLVVAQTDNKVIAKQYDDGSVYEGTFKDGRQDGIGSYRLPNGYEYTGDWVAGEIRGTGVARFPNGSVYEGLFAAGTPEGKGKITFPDGGTYEGDWANGQMTGVGVAKYANGVVYAGSFLNAVHHGTGAMKSPSGYAYHGDWVNGVKEGLGRITYPDGTVYNGAMIGDQRSGEGTFTWLDGKKYAGEFKEDKFNGHGTLYHADGRIDKQGMWRENEFAGSDLVDPTTSPDAETLILAASGTGFAVSSSGHILTNFHVIDGCGAIFLHDQGLKFSTVLIAGDPMNDLAIIKANFQPQSTLPLATESPAILDEIYVAGFPFGTNVSSTLKVTKGIISSLSGIGDNYSQFQMDAALQPGNSGGPVFDDKGNVVGVAVAKLDLGVIYDSFGAIPENTNFAIRASVAKTLVEGSNIETVPPSTVVSSKAELGRIMINSTFYISCWMTSAQIMELKTEKVMFSEILQ